MTTPIGEPEPIRERYVLTATGKILSDLLICADDLHLMSMRVHVESDFSAATFELSLIAEGTNPRTDGTVNYMFGGFSPIQQSPIVAFIKKCDELGLPVQDMVMKFPKDDWATLTVAVALPAAKTKGTH